MENNEVLQKIVELCDSIVETHERTMARSSESAEDTCRRVRNWHADFKSRYGDVMNRLKKLGDICMSFGDYRNDIYKKERPYECTARTKRDDVEIYLKIEYCGYPTIYVFENGYTKGSCSMYYPLNNQCDSWMVELFKMFLDVVNLDDIDKCFALKIAEMSKIISDHDKTELDRIGG